MKMLKKVSELKSEELENIYGGFSYSYQSDDDHDKGGIDRPDKK